MYLADASLTHLLSNVATVDQAAEWTGLIELTDDEAAVAKNTFEDVSIDGAKLVGLMNVGALADDLRHHGKAGVDYGNLADKIVSKRDSVLHGCAPRAISDAVLTGVPGSV